MHGTLINSLIRSTMQSHSNYPSLTDGLAVRDGEIVVARLSVMQYLPTKFVN